MDKELIWGPTLNSMFLLVVVNLVIRHPLEWASLASR